MNSLNDILEAKSKANLLISEKKYKDAEIAYKKLLDDIEIILNNENVENKDEIINQKKLIMSNLSFALFKQYKVTEGMKYDRIIIKKLDKTFAKSYARLIDGYLQCDKIKMANYHYDLMKQNVDQETINKCSDIINKLKEKVKTEDQGIESLLMMKNLIQK